MRQISVPECHTHIQWETCLLSALACQVAQHFSTSNERHFVVFAISFLQEQSDLAPHRLQIYANNFSKYMRQTYGRRSFLTLWDLGLYAYKQRKQLFVNILAS